MPEKDLTLNTSLYVKRWSHPFVIYSDFETLLCPITSQTKTNTQLLNKHEPTGFMLYCVSTYDDVPFETTYFYRGVDCMDKFYKCLNKLSYDIREFYRSNWKYRSNWNDLQNRQRNHDFRLSKTKARTRRFWLYLPQSIYFGTE